MLTYPFHEPTFSGGGEVLYRYISGNKLSNPDNFAVFVFQKGYGRSKNNDFENSLLYHSTVVKYIQSIGSEDIVMDTRIALNLSNKLLTNCSIYRENCFRFFQNFQGVGGWLCSNKLWTKSHSRLMK